MQGARYYKVIFTDNVESMELAYDALDAWNCALIRRSSELGSADDEDYIVPSVKSVEGIAKDYETSGRSLDPAAKSMIQDIFRELNEVSKKNNEVDKKNKE